jgi:hypothetical protein
MKATHRPQWDISLREPNLRMPTRALGEIMFPFLGQRKSVIAKGSDTGGSGSFQSQDPPGLRGKTLWTTLDGGG